MTTSPRQTESQSRSWVEAVLELLPVAVLLIDPQSGAVTWANSRADRLAGGAFPRGTDRFGRGTPGFQALNPETGEPLRIEEAPSYVAAQTGRRVDGFHIDISTADGLVSVVASAELMPPIGDMEPAVVVSFEDVTELRNARRTAEDALVAERDARAAAEVAARRARFLAEASGVLDRSLDYDETLESIAALAVPDIADWCTVDALEHGELRNVVVRHVDPEKTAFGERLLGTFHYPPDAPNGPPEVVRTGHSELLTEITDEVLVANARNQEHLEMLRELGMHSVMVVPMISRSRMLGTITFVSAESSRQFGEDDVLLAEDLGRRAAVAFDNARLYSERAQIARTLQESLLPPQLPTIAGVEIAARYLAAGEGIEVGGDFYDLFEVAPGDWAIVMGDVCGKGADAAALTALARYTLRATARPDALPSDALQTLNDEVLRQRSDGRFITVAYARLAVGDGGRARVTLSLGGHPAPIVQRTDGSAAPVGSPGTLLGVVSDPTLTNDEIELGPGDSLFLYTDGVTEAYAPDHLLEVEDVARIVAGCAEMDAADLVKCVEDEVRSLGNGPPGDDIAMLALRMTQNGEAPGP